MAKYNANDITYSIARLIEAEFINATISRTIGSGDLYIISSITWSGHEFIDSVRSPEIWRKTKDKAEKIGKFSLSTLSELAVQIGTNLLLK